MGTENERSTRIFLKHLHNCLKPQGFHKRGKTFVAELEDVTLIVNLQSSVSSTQNEMLITMNFAVHSLLIEQKMDTGELKRSRSVWDNHWYERIGTQKHGDIWWQVCNDEQAERAGKHMAHLLVQDGLPALKKVSSTKQLQAEWTKGHSPGLTEILRKQYLDLLEG